eukprot:Gb_28511 [translate_table: standard]
MVNNWLVLWMVMGCLLVLNAHALRASPSYLGHGSFSGAFRGRSKSSVKQQFNAISSDDLETHYYTQTLDHFTYTPEGYRTFQHRYLVNTKYWGGPQTNSPIFVYTGDEGNIVSDYDAAGFMIDIAPHFRALLVYIEHRYYGLTMPFGSREESYKNASTLGYFTSTQALADYATIIIDLKKNLSAQECPVIVLGGSYGGMLAAWFRLKYPHIAIGALASSAPILYFENITPQDGYASVVTRDFRSASERCYNTIKNSWGVIDKVASEHGGLQILSNIFKTCKVLKSTVPLVNSLVHAYDTSAQYNDPQADAMSKAIDGHPEGTNILTRISAGALFYYNRTGMAAFSSNCLELEEYLLSDTLQGWSWQSCTEMVMPFSDTPTTMFPVNLFNIKAYAKDCQSEYGVQPRPNWITTEFGGHGIKRVLKRFGSNIIFSNGLRDPYSSGGVLESISKTIVAIVTNEGSHCEDLYFASEDDPEWLKEQRSKEINIMKTWIKQYNHDLLQMS